MKVKTLLWSILTGLLSALLVVWRFISYINKPNQESPNPSITKLQEKHKKAEKHRDAVKMNTAIQVIKKTAKKQKEDLNEETISNLVDKYNNNNND